VLNCPLLSSFILELLECNEESVLTAIVDV
jgi:hypothetical protein